MDTLNGDEYEQPIEGVAEDEPKVDSPRTVWFRDNRELLSKKEEEEKAAKEEIMAKAREHIATFNADRQNRIEKTKKLNREEEAKAVELKEKPTGSIWEQIVHMIDFNLGVQQKDVSRARSLLFQAKEADLPTKN